VPSSPPEPPTHAHRAGDLIGGRYRLAARLARGGMAEVWEAEDEVLSRPVAVKALLPHLAADDAFLARFRREAVAAARLSHPHIVSIYDTCATETCEAIVMELVRGRTLRDQLDQDGALPLRRAVDVAAQVADALDHAHEHGLVHRDVKPANILLALDGRVLVADFGIAKAAEAVSDLTEAGQVVGTAKYLSPEQVEGHAIDGRSDVYALGVVLYEMLCGRPPFTGETSTATALARLRTDPLRPRQIRAGIPRALEDVVLRAMARRPDGRFRSAAELRTALLGLDLSRVDDPTEDAALSDLTPIPPSPRTERGWWVPVVAIVVIAVTLAVVGLVVRQTDVGDTLFGGNDGSGAAAAPVIASTAAFDPFGGDGEHDDDAGLAHDGNPSTAWTTQTYALRTFGTKPGVGMVLRLQSAARVGTLTVTSPSSGWKADVYLADEPAAALDGWGSPVGEIGGAAGKSTVDIGRRGGAVLLWITDLGEDRRFELSEIDVRA
jgi:serine/threonine-protein kinase